MCQFKGSVKPIFTEASAISIYIISPKVTGKVKRVNQRRNKYLKTRPLSAVTR